MTSAEINWFYLIPEGLILFCIILLCFFEFFLNHIQKYYITILCCSFLIISLIVLILNWMHFLSETGSVFSFFESFETDSLTILFRILIVLATLFSILFSFNYIENSTKLIIEFNIFILTAALGGMLLSGANNLILVFISFETLSLSSYLLTAYTKLDNRSNEAALKYFSLGALSSCIVLYSFSLIYGFSNGNLELNIIHQNILTWSPEKISNLIISFLFLIVGIGFKLAAAPFHQWAPDVYEGSPTPAVAFLSIGSKAAIICFTIRILSLVFFKLDYQKIFELLAILSLIIGSFSALNQQSFKRLLAYSSINQIGFLLIGFTIATKIGYISLIFYLIVYFFTNFGVFACLILYSLKTGKDTIQDYKSLTNKNPLFSFCLICCLLSLAGFPPFSGFFSKLSIFILGWQSGHYTLIFIALLTSLVSIFYYLRIIKIMILPSSNQFRVTLLSYSNLFSFGLSLFVCLFGTIFIGFFGNWVFNLIEQTLNSTPYII
uniref:NAD(P)H-quinone oxidoreductase subunit 2, chloroplastic n=1 Tax=Verdigellas peltata TaxID=542676 RepID=A0A170TN05_9VIRI|nr:subunit 2 of NADH-plastoquinone oxidoreductase [Verdigellas peltata]CZF96650.1 subunit 2 of NADH-plastoquinone oxidoreductase [Verdigellas peltata]